MWSILIVPVALAWETYSFEPEIPIPQLEAQTFFTLKPDKDNNLEGKLFGDRWCLLSLCLHCTRCPLLSVHLPQCSPKP